MEKIAYRMLAVVKRKQVDFNRDEEFIYGMTVILSEICIVAVLLGFGIVFNKIVEMILFIFIFSFIRADEDCIHMETPLACLITTCLCALASLLMYQYINSIMLLFLLLFCSTLCYFFIKKNVYNLKRFIFSFSSIFVKIGITIILAIIFLSCKNNLGYYILDVLNIAILTTIKWR